MPDMILKTFKLLASTQSLRDEPAVSGGLSVSWSVALSRCNPAGFLRGTDCILRWLRLTGPSSPPNTLAVSESSP